MKHEYLGLFGENYNVFCFFDNGRLYFDVKKMTWLNTTNEIVDLEDFYIALLNSLSDETIDPFVKWFNRFFLPLLSYPNHRIPPGLIGHKVIWFKKGRINALGINDKIFLQVADVKNVCKVRTIETEPFHSEFFQCKDYSISGKFQWYVTVDFLRKMLPKIKEDEIYMNLLTLLEGLPFYNPKILSNDEIEMYCSIAKELAIHREDLVRKWWKVINRPALSLNP